MAICSASGDGGNLGERAIFFRLTGRGTLPMFRAISRAAF
jgi:hypothetical protein